MKIDFEGQVRALDLVHVKLRDAVAIQEFTGLAVFAWEERLSGLGGATQEAFEADPMGTVRAMPMYSDPAWIMSVAAAHWLMLTQAGEEPPPLDDDYDCDVLGFYLAFISAYTEEVKAKAVQDKPGPPAPRARRAQSSKPTATRKKPSPQASPSLPLTGS